MKDKYNKYFYLLLIFILSACTHNNKKPLQVKEANISKQMHKVKKNYSNNTYYQKKINNDILKTSEEIQEIIIDKQFQKKHNYHSSINLSLKKISSQNNIKYNKKTNSFIFYNTTTINKKFKTTLSNFIHEYIKIIIKNKNLIEEIRIKNYTSSEYKTKLTKKSKFIANSNLSRKRAINIKNYVLSIINIDKKNKLWIEKHFFAYGMGSINLVRYKNFIENKLKSRRTTFQIIYK